MKKLWNQEWKYHMLFTVLAIVLVMGVSSVQNVINTCGYYIDMTNESLFSFSVLDICNSMALTIFYDCFDNVIVTMTVVMLVKKGFLYWQENNRCGREFFQSLPIRKKERFLFHLYMDIIMVVVPIVIYTLYGYMKLKEYMENVHQIEIPWLFASYCGIAITTISFMIMLLGLLYLMDMLFTNGYMKLVGFGGGCIMTVLSVNRLFGWLPFNQFVQKLYGFVTLHSVGGNGYVVPVPEYKLDDYTWFSSRNYYTWIHDNLNAPVRVKGEWLDYSEIKLYTGDYMEWISDWNRLFDFSRPHSYMFHVAGYLLIGFALVGIAFYLLKKKDVSKEEFYFDAGRYLMSGAIACTMFLVIVVWNGNPLQIICELSASIIVFFLLLYLLNPERKKQLPKRMEKGS